MTYDEELLLSQELHERVVAGLDGEWGETDVRALYVWIHRAVKFRAFLKFREARPNFQSEPLTQEEKERHIAWIKSAPPRTPPVIAPGDLVLASAHAKLRDLGFEDRSIALDIVDRTSAYVDISLANHYKVGVVPSFIRWTAASKDAFSEEYLRLFDLFLSETDVPSQCRLVVDMAMLQIAFSLLVLE